MEIFEKSLKPPAPPRKVNSRVPEAIDAICMRCLAQNRDERFANCGELRQALEQYLASSGRPLGPPQLAQFMRILFPPDKDPVRKRIEGLIATPLPEPTAPAPVVAEPTVAIAPPSAPHSAPVPRAVTVEHQLPVDPSAEIPPYDDDKTQVAAPMPDLPTAESADIQTVVPPSIEFGNESDSADLDDDGGMNVATVELNLDSIDVVMESRDAPPPFLDEEDGIDISMDGIEPDFSSGSPPPISGSVEADYEPEIPPFADEAPPRAVAPEGDALFDTTPPPPHVEGPPIPQAGPPIPEMDGPIRSDAATAMLEPGTGNALFTDQSVTESTEPTPRATKPAKQPFVARAASFSLGSLVGLILLIGGLYAAGQLTPLTRRLGVELPIELPTPPWLVDATDDDPVL